MRCAIVTVALVGSLVWIAPSAAQQTRGLAMSEAEIRARLDAMNRKASTQATTQPTASKADRLAAVRATQQIKAQKALDELNSALADEGAAAKQLAQIEVDLSQVRAAGQTAWGELTQLAEKYNIASSEADKAGKSYFSGESVTVLGGNAGDVSTFNGVINDPSKRLSAIRAVESQYGPELQKVRQQVDEIYQAQQVLMGHQFRLQRIITQAKLRQLAARTVYREAGGDRTTTATPALAMPPGFIPDPPPTAPVQASP